MPALATIDDIEARLGRSLAGSEVERMQSILDDVSGVVRAYTGQQFDLVSDDTVRLRVRRGTARLTQSPVSAVTAVTNVDGDTMAYTWDAGQVVNLGGYGHPINGFEIEPFGTRDQWVDVVYTHGYAEVPADVVAVVCQMAGRAFGRTADTTGVTQESIAGYSYSVGAAAAAGAAGMMADERSVLDRYRRPLGSIQVAP